MKKRPVLVLLLAVFFLLVLPLILTGLPTTTSRQPLELPELEMDEIFGEDVAAERYWRMVDIRGREIMITGRRIYVGDEYITGDNKLYRVYLVRGRTAYARYIREVGAFFETEQQGILAALLHRVLPVQTNEDEGDDLAPEAEPQRLIGVYHTHNAESYVPSEGTDSIFGKGGIHKVGDSFAVAMEEKGVTVIHDETLHLPHDRGAYRRSRPTAQRLLGEGPDAIFDIHRDAAPRHVYASQVGDEWVTQVQLVVGRQNPNMTVNRQFALDLKNAADEVHPNLVKGIFMANGHYNQDLSPLNLLLEVGAHTNSREAAEDGAALFTDVVAFYFYGPEEEREEAAPPFGAQRPPGAATGRATRIATSNILMLLGVTAAIIIGFVLLNTGRISDLTRALAPYLAPVVRLLKRGDRILEPLQSRLYELSAPLREFLTPYVEKLRLLIARIWQSLVPYMERGDELLLPAREAIHAMALRIWHYLYPRLRAADRYLSGTQERSHLFSRRVWDRVAAWRRREDEKLLLLQKKIRDVALSIKERLLELYSRLRQRGKLK